LADEWKMGVVTVNRIVVYSIENSGVQFRLLQ
jgi:hypothetical protein